MKLRSLIIGGLMALCVAAVFGVLAQHQQLTNLQAEQKQVLAKLAELSSPPAETAGLAPEQWPAQADPGTSPELLRLRSEVTALSARKRALAGIVEENSRLKEQLASRGTNALGTASGMLLASRAQMVGYNTPEDTMQSMLWAVKNLDLTNFLQALQPNVAKDFLGNVPADAPQGLLRALRAQFGAIKILGREQLPDGAVQLSVEVVPGQTDHVRLRQTGGLWKIDSM